MAEYPPQRLGEAGLGDTPPVNPDGDWQVNPGVNVRMMSNAQIDAYEKAAAEKKQQEPVIQELAGYVRGCWEEAKTERSKVEERMMESLRQRRGEYDPQVLQRIREQGGSEIFMMITSVKCRAAASWLRDALLTSGTKKPWTIRETPMPELPANIMQAINMRVNEEVQRFLSAGGLPPTPQMIQIAQSIAQDRMLAEQRKSAKKAAKYVEDYMHDQLIEGKFEKALSQFIDDLVTFPCAFLKGPVLRNKPKMSYAEDGQPVVEDQILLEWERVSPLYVYPSPQAEDVHDGYLFERHIMSRQDLSELIGVEGYDEGAIRQVLEEYMRGGLNEWLNIDYNADSREESHHDGREIASSSIDALQFWGNVPGRLLREWGMSEEEVPDEDIDYAAEVWMVGRWVIKATINPDPLKRRPYYKTSYEEIPGQFWGHGVTDLVRDVQRICNASARALSNNMGFASGPQVWVNVERLPDGEEITQLTPWKIHQGLSDPAGGAAPPVGFFQPQSLAGELMAVYEKFSDLADEYSGIPKYMTGTDSAPGAGRTASGLSMMMSNAGKTIKQVLTQIDVNVMTPMLEMLFYHNMRYSDDPRVKNSDVEILARGASGIVKQEAQQVRLNEFLNITIGSQTVAQIIGPEGIATLLRQAAEQLDLDTDKLVPSEEMIRADQMAKEQEQKAMMMQQQQLLAAAQNQPIESIDIERDPETGEMKRMKVMPGVGSGQQLMDGTPVTDNFSPQRRAQ